VAGARGRVPRDIGKLETTITANDGTSVARERLAWPLETSGHPHIVDLLPAVGLGSVSVALDGQVIARLVLPTPQHPWQEVSITIEGQTFVVGLTWHVPVMRTDLFARGRSLLDDRPIEEVRGAAPPPLSNYEVWIGGLSRPFAVPRRSFLPGWMALVCIVSIVALLLIFSWQPRPSGLLAGLAAGVALLSLYLIWFRSWVVVLDRTHAYLLARPHLGDARRLAGFFGALVGYPLVAIALLVALEYR